MKTPTGIKSFASRVSRPALALSLTLGLAFGAQAETIKDVKYIDANGIEQTCPEATLVTNETEIINGWCVVTGTVECAGISVSGAAHLILADGCSLTAKEETLDCAGITVKGDSNSFAIYGQAVGSGKLDASGGNRGAGIGNAGSGASTTGGNITINGGIVTATGGSAAAGIGGGQYGSGTNITINGGTVTATGGDQGAGIGGGSGGKGENITINGGTVTAAGGGGEFGTGDGIGNAAHASSSSTNIKVNPLMLLKAGASENPSTEVAADRTMATDVASALKGQQYATAAIDYTIVLTNGVAYKSADNGQTLSGTVTLQGLSYEGNGVWTMNNFNFKTTAKYGMQVLGDDCVTIRLDGDNAVTSGDVKGDSSGNISAIEFNCDAKIVGVGTLTVAVGRYDSNSSAGLLGIMANGSLTIQDATVVAKGGTDGTASGTSKSWNSIGIFVDGAFDVIDADVTVMAFPSGGTRNSWGLSFADSVRVTGSGKVSVTANGYAVALSDSPTGTEPDAMARDFDGHNLTWFAVDYSGTYLQYGSDSAIATNVILTAKPSVPIEAKPNAAPEHATIAAVLTNGVAAAEIAGKAGYYPAWSNGTAVVVYKADTGWCFENGATEVTNKLDTAVDPAVNKEGEVVPPLGQPVVQLGVVAQRYPWNGVLDVQYRATYVKNTPATLTVVANGTAYPFDVTVSAGVNTLAVTLPAEIKAKDAKVTLKLK